MKRFAFAAVAALGLFAMPVAAQELLGGYYTTLQGADLQNSRGQRLGDFCAVVQQDRANYHKFGIRHQGDESDPWFTTLKARQTISSDCRIGQGSEYIPSVVMGGGTRFVHVQVFGRGGVPAYVVVHEGAG